MFSSPTMQMADSSLTTSVIMAGWLGSMARASNVRLFSSLRIRSRPNCNVTSTSHQLPANVISPTATAKVRNAKARSGTGEWLGQLGIRRRSHRSVEQTSHVKPAAATATKSQSNSTGCGEIQGLCLTGAQRQIRLNHSVSIAETKVPPQ